MMDIVAEHKRQGRGCLVGAFICTKAVRATSLFVDLCTAILQVRFSNTYHVKTVSLLQRAQIGFILVCFPWSGQSALQYQA